MKTALISSPKFIVFILILLSLFHFACSKCDSVTQSGLELLCERQVCLIEPDVVSGVNNDRSLGWTAANYSMFWGRPLSDGITYRTGTLLPHRTVKRMMPVMKTTGRLPRTFDARNKWPGLVAGSFDQDWCGSSWAVSTVAVASDRFAIMSRGEFLFHEY